jgi:transcriptional regulator with XRE-family HTH domain
MTILSGIFYIRFETFGGIIMAFTRQIKQFGNEVKRLRTEKNLTQDELADACDIDVRTIARIESGVGNYSVGLGILFSLCGALEVNPSELFANIKVPVTAYVGLGKTSKARTKKKKK